MTSKEHTYNHNMHITEKEFNSFALRVGAEIEALVEEVVKLKAEVVQLQVMQDKPLWRTRSNEAAKGFLYTPQTNSNNFTCKVEGI
jgi:hypothetical protein